MKLEELLKDPDLARAISKLYVEWCRLKGYKASTSPIEQMVDEATGFEAAKMQDFSKWLVWYLLPRFIAP